MNIAGQSSKALRSYEDDGLVLVPDVVQGAMVLSDSGFEQMTLKTGKLASNPRSTVLGTCNELS
jgi:hypothetical protein